MRSILMMSLILISASHLCSGCRVGPSHQLPSHNLPATYHAQLDKLSLSTSSHSRESIQRWWNQFNDPTLKDIVEHSVTANLDIQIAQSRILEARALLVSARTKLDPEANISATAQRSRISANSTMGQIAKSRLIPMEQNLFDTGFDMNWEIDIFGGKRHSIQAAKADLQGTLFVRQGVLISVLAEVGTTYFELRSLEQQIRLTATTITSQKQSLVLIRDRVKSGLDNELGALTAERELAGVKALLAPLEAARMRALNRLSVLSSLSLDALKSKLGSGGYSSEFELSKFEIPLGLPSEILRRRPDIQQAEADIMATCSRVGIATAELFPKFRLIAAGGLQSVEAADLATASSRYWALGPGMRWPILDFRRIRASIRQASARHEQAFLRYQKSVLIALEETENSILTLNQEAARHKALTEALAASQSSLKLVTSLYKAGLRSYGEVLLAERNVWAAQISLVQSQHMLTQNLIRLFKALGGGNEE